MTVSALTSTPQTAAPSAAPAAEAKPAINSDFQTFLKMLTTQLENQDPLNPLDSSQFAVQLATFSGVEQQMQTNTLLKGLGGQLGVMGMSELAGWVGKQARADMPVFFDGAPVTLTTKADALATSAQLVVRNATGGIVAREDVAPSATSLSWAGTAADGTALSPGRYALSLESYADGALIGTAPVESYGRIVEARTTGGKTILLLSGGVEIAAEDVTALRAE